MSEKSGGSTSHKAAAKGSQHEKEVRSRGSTGASLMPLGEGVVGNLALQDLLRSRRVLAKLRIGPPNDALEQEAESMADRVVGGQAGGCHCSGTCDSCRDEESALLRRSPNLDGSSSPRSAPEGLLESLGTGRPLETGVRRDMETRFGHDLGEVRIHTDNQAAALARSIQARAFTAGTAVVFDEGEYRPGAREGRRLLAHELTHVGQQRSGERALQRQERPEGPTDRKGSLPAVSGGAAMGLEMLDASSMVQGFGAAGPNAIGIVAMPRTPSLQSPVPESTSLWGHTAVYVRINGEIVMVRGFNPQMGAAGLWRLVTNYFGILSGRVGVPSEVTSDAWLFTKTNAQALEVPVSLETAQEMVRQTPVEGPGGRPGVPPEYTARPANFEQGPCVGTNCGLFAVRNAEAGLGGKIGPASVGESVVDLGSKGSIVADTASQGRIINFFKSLITGEVELMPLPAATGAPRVLGMRSDLRILRWGGRVMIVAAPVAEFIMNLRQHLPIVQNVFRTAGVGAGALALPGLYGGGSFIGLQKGTRIGGLADLLVNLTNLVVQLTGAPEWVSAITETGAQLTPSNVMFSGVRSSVDYLYAAVSDKTSFEEVHQQQLRSGGMISGYAMIGGVIGGEDLDFLTSPEAARGDYGIFVESGNYWGDVAAGERSLTSDLKEIWDWIWD
jgi:hypothetical protein